MAARIFGVALYFNLLVKNTLKKPELNAQAFLIKF